jgi:amino acid adenylation domain-containing protein
VVDRHDILRTAMAWEGLPEPVQVVHRQAKLPIEELVFDPAQGDVEQQLRERLDPRHHRIDVRQAPLLRCHVAHDAPNGRWLLCILAHHLILDHTTLELVIEEALAFEQGRGAELPEPVPFRNVVAQARLGISEQEHEAFFRSMLGDIDEPTAPFGLLDVQGDGSAILECKRLLPQSLSAEIRACAKDLRVGAASVMHLAWALVLARATGRSGVVFGTVLFGRLQGGAAADRALGLFVNTLPVRLDIGNEPVRSGLLHTHERLAQLIRHEHASLAVAQRCGAVGTGAPLFTSLLNFRYGAQVAAAARTGAVDPDDEIHVLSAQERTNYPLTLSVDDLGSDFRLTAQVSDSIDAERVCEFMLQALEELVYALREAPLAPMCNLDVLPPAERTRLVVEWNDTQRDFPRDQCIHELFEQQVRRTPDATALVEGKDSLTYAQLNRRANQCARHLIDHGVTPGDTVALLLPRSADLVVAELAVLKCGAAYVPLDGDHPPERLRFMVDDSKAQLILATDRVPAFDPDIRRVNVEDIPFDVPTNALGLATDAGSAAYVMYTSGSTGTPKGVEISHRAIARLVLNNGYLDVDASDRVAFVANAAFDASTLEVWSALLNGAALIVVGQATLLEPNGFAGYLSEQQVTILHLTAGLLGPYRQALSTVIPRLRCLLTGGDKPDVAALAAIMSECPPQRLLHCYGPTETTTFATTHEVRQISAGARSIPLGRPISNTRVYILDAESRPAPIGVEGEIHIGGAGVARGYLNRAQLNAERFVPDPFVCGERIYRTGDRGRWLPDGTIEFLGRNDHQIKVRGFRIEPGEIEATLLRHPGVREVLVVGREDAPGDKRLVGYWVAHEDRPIPSAAELRELAAQSLPEYMVPSAFVCMASLPLTPNGKLDRRALPAPDGVAYASRSYEAPQGEIECALAGHWSELLKVGQVGRHDNFFELGGHSLLAISLVSRIRASLGFEVGLAALFGSPTLSGFAVAVAGSPKSAATPIQRAPRQSVKPS